ncbi:MAG: glutamine amidotransferase, partial [Gaiellales bacterium]
RAALVPYGVELEQMPAHSAAEDFPLSLEGLAAWDVIVLSDIGADTLLLHPDVWLRGQRVPNRLQLLHDWVLGGGGLAMAGGYLSFQGIGGKARYRGTPIEAVLPCTIDPFDDRVEAPQGVEPVVVAGDHPILAGVGGAWPALLGYNRVTLRPDATLLARVGDDPMLAVGSAGAGRTLIWTSDIGPHWCPDTFCAWAGFGQIWSQALRWLARD